MTETVVPIRKRPKKASPLKTSFGVFLLLGVVSVFAWVAEVTATGRKKEKLRRLRSQTTAMRRDSKEMLRKVEASNGQDSLELIDELLAKHGDDEMRREHRESMTEVQAITRVGDDLKHIVQKAGEDKARAVRDIQEYIQEHGDSGLAYGYLGGMLRQVGQFDESISAYQTEARLWQAQGLSHINSRLQIGLVLQEKGDIEAAIAEFRDVIQSCNPERDGMLELAYLYLGDALEEKCDLKNARIAWKEAIRWDQFTVIGKTAREKIKAGTG